MQNPYLLQDKECLTTVLEVVELGISGSKSIGKPSEPIKLKDEKELKPVSIRVREAAETLLVTILEQVGHFPNECGPQSVSSLLDEITLYKHCNSNPSENNSVSVTPEQAVQKFRYFVTENSTILALLEEPLGNDQDPQPTVTRKCLEFSLRCYFVISLDFIFNSIAARLLRPQCVDNAIAAFATQQIGHHVPCTEPRSPGTYERHADASRGRTKILSGWR